MGDEQSAKAYGAALDAVDGLSNLVDDYGGALVSEPGLQPLVMEFILEGMHQSRVLSKDELETGAVYRDMLGSMFEDIQRKG